MLVMGVEIPDADIEAMRKPADPGRKRYHHAYHWAHRDEIIAKKRERYRDPEVHAARLAYWQREDVKQRRNERERERYRSDPAYRERLKAKTRAAYAAKKASVD